MSRFSNLEFGDHQADLRAQPAHTTPHEETRLLAEADQWFRRGYFEPALRHFARVLETNPLSLPAWAGQVRLLLELGDTAEAHAWADRALEHLPEAADLLALKAVALARTGDTEAALAFSDAAVGNAAGTPAVWLARGEVLLSRRDARSEYCLAKALTAAPDDWFWPWLASRACLFHRQFARALKLARQALGLGETATVLWLQLARCQGALGLATEAAHALAQAEQLDAACPEIPPVREALRAAGPWHRWVGRWRRLWQAGS